MKLQFSLATLLVCVTVLAVVCVMSMRVPVYELESSMPDGVTVKGSTWPPQFVPHALVTYWVHEPNAADVMWRLAIWGPVSVAARLATLWLVRRLKSRPSI